ncbi:sugar ABC transporter permease [Kamptonema cortianum]|nr:sugar ABC transporter permease [Geitlerinema splendidum]MDK3161025.1 sugar ABC transporter permease [Kamptonema cortianum]
MTKQKKQVLAGILFALPWIVGFTAFLAVPLLQAFYYSFTEYSVLTPPVWIGLNNYEALMRDELFWKSLGNTLLYAGLAIPLSTVSALTLAILLNAKVKGQAFYRTFFFLPSLIPAVPLAILWLWLFNGDAGIVNSILTPIFGWFDKTPPNWLGDETWAKGVLVIMSMWTVGHAMVIYLAGLQEVPNQLYEAADLDGATPWQKMRSVTLPLLSPVIMFNVIMGIIGSLQIFTQPYVMFPGGAPARSTYFYTMYIYDAAFRDNRMGYASAMGWIMFLIILVLTLLALNFFEKRVHYEGG